MSDSDTNDGDTSDTRERTPSPVDVGMGETLYTEGGHPVGTVRGVREGGLFVTLRAGAEALSVEHVRSGGAFGEAELMWRCTGCGEMGAIDDGLPDECPNGGEPREALAYWVED